MRLRWLIATFHLLVLPMGLAAIVMRARALRRVRSSADLPPVFLTDSIWGIAAVLWVATGLWRAFGGLEKGSSYYLGSHTFRVKMGLLALIFVLEIWPMATLIRWRIHAARAQPIDLGRAGLFARISVLQALLVVGMVFAATAMARGL